MSRSTRSRADGLLADVAEALNHLDGDIVVKRRDDGASLEVERFGQTHVLALDNLLAETRDTNAQARADAIQRFVRNFERPLAAVPDWEDASERLVPILRPSSFAARLPTPPVERVFLPFLMECVAIDSDESLQVVTAQELREWDVPAEHVFEAAHAVAARAFADSGAIEPYDDATKTPLLQVASEDSYESSRLLIPGFLASFAPRVKGRPVAIVPHRSLLLVGGDGDEKALLRLIDLARREYDASTRKISPALYTVDAAARVVPLSMPEGHPLEDAVNLGHAVLAASEYAIQKQALDQSDEDVFVASLDASQDENGSLYTYTTWPLGIPTLLPRADRVVVMPMKDGEPDGDSFEVAWAVVEKIAGNCLTPEPKLNPLRFRTTSTPSAAQLKALSRVSFG